MVCPMPLRSLFPVAVVLWVTACASLNTRVQAPYITIAGVEVTDVTLFEQRYQVQMRIQNPNDFELPIVGMSYELYINDRRFARGVSPVAVTISRFGEALVTVGMVSDLGSVLDSLRTRESPAGEGHGVFKYRLNGDVKLSNRVGTLPFEYAGEFNLKQAR
jgi:LEA14-like dessication related protein